jgi:hypothetical protein
MGLAVPADCALLSGGGRMRLGMLSAETSRFESGATA